MSAFAGIEMQDSYVSSVVDTVDLVRARPGNSAFDYTGGAGYSGGGGFGNEGIGGDGGSDGSNGEDGRYGAGGTGSGKCLTQPTRCTLNNFYKGQCNFLPRQCPLFFLQILPRNVPYLSLIFFRI